MAFDPKGATDAVARARSAVKDAKLFGYDVAIVDTAGRLHVDEVLMDESPDPRGDGAGRDPVRRGRDDRAGRGALGGGVRREAPAHGRHPDEDGRRRPRRRRPVARESRRQAAEVHGHGEKVADLEPFHPDRAASRLLGLGDVLTLIEKVSAETDEAAALRAAEKLRKNTFTLTDLREQMAQLKKMGPLGSLLGHLPKVGPMKQLANLEIPEDATKSLEAMIDSMTPAEREDPKILDGSRKKRIAKGSGTSVPEVNQLLKQYLSMKKMMKGAARMRG